jgi:hypothetical protein
MKPDKTGGQTRIGCGPRRPGPLQRTIRLTLSVLLVLSHPLRAATIIVDETTCTLVDAITAANADAAVGGCPAGSGADTIQLTTDVTLTEVNNYYLGDNGLPFVEGEIIIEGGGFTIERNVDAPPFRLVVVRSGASLSLDDITLRNGKAGFAPGILNDIGTLTLTNSTVTANEGLGGYPEFASAIYNNTAYAHLHNTTISGNFSGLYSYQSEVWLTDSTVSDNSYFGIHADYLSAFHATNCTVSGNDVGLAFGGGRRYYLNELHRVR